MLALFFIAYASYSYVSEKLGADPLNIESVDGRPFINVTQPDSVTFSGSLDNSGYDVSHPQCKTVLPSGAVDFVIIGLNKGKPFTENPCFARQWQWALTHDGAAIYINTADPGESDPASYGQKIAKANLDLLSKHNVPKNIPIWLDVEMHNTWSSADRAVSVITETMHILTENGYYVGIYSTTAHWLEITMGAKLGVPTWRAIGEFSDVASGVAAAKEACTQAGIAGTMPAIVQFVTTVDGLALDRNIMCSTNPNGLVGSTK